MKKIFVFIAFIVFSTGAFSSEWVYVGSVPGESEVKVDKSSIASTLKSNRKAWVLFTYNEKQTQKSAPYAQYDELKALWRINCSTHEVGTKAVVWRLEGNLVDSTDIQSTSFNDVVPDSIGEIVFNYVCRSKIKS
ncbi:MAG: hypothetical protein Q8L80_07920 [Gallionella sp.]|nr:hypothetical protein [Gallionella sp.]MDP1941263.1 hypothetical protein [Gallionella sp.]